MFLPQVTTAIVASLLGSGLARRITMKRVYLIGLACSAVSMGLLIASTGVKTDQSVAYPLLLVATAFLGAGFGLTAVVAGVMGVLSFFVTSARSPTASPAAEESGPLQPPGRNQLRRPDQP
ncbi:MFS family permease [Streptacidiphilus sp. BW17]|uniref:hypothetical protein n=1 Tax=Streptacidiphilus sp. BW17 TaxID=3156274 RepID=UPI003512B5BF